MNVTDRINRILFIMSYVSQNQGVTVDELAAQVALKPRELLKEIDFILLVGKPPFQPGTPKTSKNASKKRGKPRPHLFSLYGP